MNDRCPNCHRRYSLTRKRTRIVGGKTVCTECAGKFRARTVGMTMGQSDGGGDDGLVGMISTDSWWKRRKRQTGRS